MTHLTATKAATGHGQLLAIERARRTHGPEVCVARPAPRRGESISYSPMANFLEMRGAGFHYSVIGGFAMIDLAPGLADCHLLNPEGATPDLLAAAGARAGEERRFNTDRAGRDFGPAEERLMQTTAVLLTACKSISR